MKLKKLLGSVALAGTLALGAVGVGPTTTHAETTVWVLHSGSTGGKHTVGTSCTKTQADNYTLGHTKWRTIIGCGYYLLHNKLAAHWTYLWFATDGSGDVWTTDGWLYPGGHRPATYVGNIFATV